MRFGVGMILIDAPHSALNMFGQKQGAGDENIVVVKTLKKGKLLYPYVSPQAWRFWWRKTLEHKFGWKLSPLSRGEKQVYTEANPIIYEDDDVFGYMWAPKTEGSDRGVSLTRVSPLKNTPLISLYPTRNSLVEDKGFASRHEGAPVPYNMEFYSTILKGAFSLDLDLVGKFYIKYQTGFMNLITPESVDYFINLTESGKRKKMKEALQRTLETLSYENKYLAEAKKMNVSMTDRIWILPKEIRKKRAAETIKALKYLFGGAKLTEYLTDVTPKFIILAMFEGGINPFISNIVYEENGEIILDKEAIIERIREYKDILEPKKVFIGKDAGFMKEWNSDIEDIKEKLKKDNITVVTGTIGDVIEGCEKDGKNIDGFVKEIEKYYDTK